MRKMRGGSMWPNFKIANLNNIKKQIIKDNSVDIEQQLDKINLQIATEMARNDKAETEYKENGLFGYKKAYNGCSLFNSAGPIEKSNEEVSV